MTIIDLAIDMHHGYLNQSNHTQHLQILPFQVHKSISLNSILRKTFLKPRQLFFLFVLKLCLKM